MKNYENERIIRLHTFEIGYCIGVAYKMAQILYRDGKKPYLAMVYDKLGLWEAIRGKSDDDFYDDDDKMPENSFLPLSLQGKDIEPWHRHFICCERKGNFLSRLFHGSKKDLVYCPMLEEPVERGEYTQKAFGRKMKTRAFISPLISSMITKKIVKREIHDD